MIDAVIRWIVARLWQRRTRATADTRSRAEWEEIFPGRCMYCSYTRWANTEHGQSLKLEPHECKEGKSPPHPLPVAKVRR